MSCETSGCCVGLILGFIAAIAIMVAAVFGVYKYFVPEADEQSRGIIERKWNDIKSSGDKLIEKTGNSETGGSQTGSAPKKAVPPEPEI